jgi:predicted acetyltransferase
MKNLSELELRPLRLEDEESLSAANHSFVASCSEMPFAFQYDEAMKFADYLDWVHSWPDGKNLPDRFVPNTFWVGVVGDQIVGRISLRHELNDFLHRIGGHIGYAVVPEHRCRGYAVAMVKQSLPLAKALGLQKVLITCDVDNIASTRVIEKCGGVFESRTEEAELKTQKNRYWIAL